MLGNKIIKKRKIKEEKETNKTPGSERVVEEEWVVPGFIPSPNFPLEVGGASGGTLSGQGGGGAAGGWRKEKLAQQSLRRGVRPEDRERWICFAVEGELRQGIGLVSVSLLAEVPERKNDGEKDSAKRSVMSCGVRCVGVVI